MNAIREIRPASDVSFVLPRLFFFITDCILRNEQCSIISHSHHDHFQTTQRYLPHVFFIFGKWRFFFRFRTNTCPHVAYSNRFRPKRCLNPCQPVYTRSCEKKRKKHGAEQLPVSSGQLKSHLSNQKIPHKKQKHR